VSIGAKVKGNICVKEKGKARVKHESESENLNTGLN